MLRLSAMVLITSLLGAQTVDQRTKVRVGIVLEGPSVFVEGQAMDVLKRELDTLVGRDFDMQYPADKYLDANYNLNTMRQYLDRLVADDEVDLVICMGVLASMQAAQGGPYAKPVFAPFAVGAELPIYPLQDGTSGVKNFNYMVTPSKVKRDIALFKQIKPVDKVQMIAFEQFADLIPGLAGYCNRVFNAEGMEVELVACNDSAQEVLDRLPEEAEFVYIAPLIRFSDSEKRVLFDGLAKRGIISFSMKGRLDVELGALAGLTPKSDMVRWLRRLAINIQRTLLGEDPADLPVLFKEASRLVLNMETARAIDWFPDWDLQIVADLINEDPSETGRRITLEGVVTQAVEVNHSLKALALGLEAGAEQIALARSNRLPSVEADATYLQVDEDTANASLGSQPERRSSASVTARQLLFSEEVNAAIDIQNLNHAALGHEYRTTALDIALDAATRYLNYLKARALYQIQKENLKLTNSNLETAIVRRDIGISGPAEVHRWESRLATDKLNAITSRNDAQSALYAVNEILNEPLEFLVEAERPSRDDSTLRTGSGPLGRYIRNARDFEMFRYFMAEEGLNMSPELARIDALIQLKERSVVSGQRAYYLPTVSLQANIEHELSRSDGAGGLAFEGLPPIELPQAKDTRWNAALNFRLPLFVGGARKHELRIEQLAVEQLKAQRQALAQRIELSIRAGMQAVASTSVGINLRADAARAASKNFDLVEEAYSRGVASSLDLLDAQNAALVAQAAAAVAEFDFFLALMRFQRASGNLDFFMSADERASYMQRLKQFYEKHK